MWMWGTVFITYAMLIKMPLVLEFLEHLRRITNLLDCFRYLAFRQELSDRRWQKSSARLITLDDFQWKNKDLAGITIDQKKISNFFNALVIVEQTETGQHVSSCGLNNVLLLHSDHEAHAEFTTG